MAVARAIDSNSGKSFIKIEISGHNLKQFCALAHGRPDENPQSEKVSGKHPSNNKKKEAATCEGPVRKGCLEALGNAATVKEGDAKTIYATGATARRSR